MAIDTTSANAVTKEFYGDRGVPNVAYKQNVALAMLAKKRIKGKYIDHPVQYGYAANRSRTPATALSKANATKFVEFNTPTVADYDAVSVETKALEEVKDEGAFLDLLTNSIDSVIKNLGNNLGSDVFNHRGAAIGQVGTVSMTTLTLKNIEDVVHFEVDMEVRSSEANGLSGALQAGSATVTAIDRTAGTLESDSNWTAQIATLDADDFLFPDGDFGLGRAGLADWVPDAGTDLSVAFYGAVRNVDSVRLAGNVATKTGIQIATAIREFVAQAAREGAEMDTCCVSYNTMEVIGTERDQNVQEVRGMANYGDGRQLKADIGFDGYRIRTPAGHINVYADRNVSDNKCWFWKQGTYRVVHSQSEPVRVEDRDGNILSRESSSFAFDIRGQSFANFDCTEPIHLGNLTVS